MSGGKDSPMLIDSDNSDSSDSERDDSPPGSPKSRSDTPPPPPPGTTSESSPGRDNIVDGAQDYVDVDESPIVVDEKAALLEEFERKKRARQMHVPTEDSEVGAMLRQHGAPYCLFGEGPAERRDRLKDLLSRLTTDQQQLQQQQQMVSRQEAPSVRRKEETWYHEGPKRLKEVRQYLLQYSIPRARERLDKERVLHADSAVITAQKQETSARLRRYQLLISQNADIRPVSCVRFSPDGQQLATASWSGCVQVWDVHEDSRGGSHALRGHEGHVDSVAWHPQARLSQSPAQLNLASCGRDGSVLLWGLESETCIASLQNVGGRATEVAFHPCGRLLAVTVDDASWRLWDVEEGEEVLFQEGHSKGVCSVSFQKDGALAATGGMDNFGRVWDLRTGRCVMFMAGHQGALLSVDWSPDGYHLASGSVDNSVRIWDVRQRVSILTLPAHTKLVSAVRYDPCHGSYLATCSYDGTVRLWPHKTCQPLRTLQGHGHKVMSVDICPNGTSIATGAFDKTYKIWGPD